MSVQDALKDQPSIDAILLSGLYLGNATSLLDIETLNRLSIKASISLLGNPLDQWKEPLITEKISAHKFVSCADALHEDILQHLGSCCDFIHEQLVNRNRPVLVHCRMGISRSATIVIAYIMRLHSISADDASKTVKSQRPQINPNPNFLVQLRLWEKMDYNIWKDEEKKIPKLEYQQLLDRLELVRSLDTLLKGLFKLQDIIREQPMHEQSKIKRFTGRVIGLRDLLSGNTCA